jgi:hypothetical protein
MQTLRQKYLENLEQEIGRKPSALRALAEPVAPQTLHQRDGKQKRPPAREARMAGPVFGNQLSDLAGD